MKLKPIIIPTEDASHLFIQNGKLFHNETIVERIKDCGDHHLYLASDAPIKEGDWLYRIHFNEVIKVTEDNLYTINHLQKIILTTDTKLIADGVSAIDGNTKAIILAGRGDWKGQEVNFLTEFCKRWNDKADMVIECEMEIDYNREYEEVLKEPVKIKLNKDGQPTLIFK